VPNFLIDGPRGGARTVVLAHGAGAPMDSPFMRAIAEGIADAGIRAVRFEFPYMAQRREGLGRRGPDPERVLIRSWRDTIEELGGGRGLVIGGKSLGGRIASMVADEAEASGLICLGYPFHPPGNPNRTRTAHLENLATPTLILQGTRDSFGRPEEVARYNLSRMIRIEWIPDGDHSFKPRASSGRTEEQNLRTAIEGIVGFVASLK
jgi:predicted alpha/beta-hydrolase family hydrolase